MNFLPQIRDNVLRLFIFILKQINTIIYDGVSVLYQVMIRYLNSDMVVVELTFLLSEVTASWLLMHNSGNARLLQTPGHVDESKATKMNTSWFSYNQLKVLTWFNYL